MEIGSRVLQADRLAVLAPVRQDQDVRMLGMVELVDYVRLGRAEAPRRLEELARGQLLRAKNQRLPGVERVLDLAELRVRQRPGQVDAGRLEAEALAERPQPEHVRAPRAPREATSCARWPAADRPAGRR